MIALHNKKGFAQREHIQEGCGFWIYLKMEKSKLNQVVRWNIL